MDISNLERRTLKSIGLALSIYITSLVAANTLGLKLMPLFGSHISVGFLSFPIVFITTDVIGEVYGKAVARIFVLAGFVSTALFMAYTAVSLALPWAAAGAWAQEGYDTVFAISFRISLASLLAFGIAEYQDVISFFFFKRKMGAKHFWLRSALSNLWSQFLDTVIFMLVAFAGIYSWPTLFGIILSWWLYKVAMGLCYTPLSYIGIYLLRDKNQDHIQ
jgi:queuosine precursor transporter